MKTLSNILSIAIAAGAGLAIGWLSAPKRGRQARAIVADELQKYKDSLDAYSIERLREAKKTIDQNLLNRPAQGSKVMNKIKEMVA
jgi:gas vesicle protein